MEEFGIITEHYKTGNISNAEVTEWEPLEGADMDTVNEYTGRISNSKAYKLLSGEAYLDLKTGKIYSNKEWLTARFRYLIIKAENEVATQKIINKMNLQREEAIRKMDITSEINRLKEAEEIAVKQAEEDMQAVLDAIQAAELRRKENEINQELARKNAEAALEKAKQDAYAATVAKIMESISPGLIEALMSNANVDMMNGLTHAVGPYAIAENESIADVTNKLLRGMPLEGALEKIIQKDKDAE